VSPSDEGEHRLQLLAARAPARGAIGERPVHSDPVELAIGVLIQTALLGNYSDPVTRVVSARAKYNAVRLHAGVDYVIEGCGEAIRKARQAGPGVLARIPDSECLVDGLFLYEL
jgi:hypothetical protein